jgi:drug/metabolite transporter (DMT)-like permease
MPLAVNPSRSSTSALVALHAAVLLFGFAGLFGPWLGWAPLWIVLGRTAIAAAALGALRFADPETRGPGLAAADLTLAGNGAVLALHWVAFFAAIQVAGVAIGLLGFASFPRFTLLFERLLRCRRFASADAWTAALVTAGLVLLTPSLRLSDPAVQGVAWGLLSGATFALLAVRNRRSRATRSATDIAYGQNLWAAFMLAPVALAMAPLPEVDGRSVVLILALGLVCTALAHTLFIGSLDRVSAHTASVVAALEPVYGIALAVLLQDERPGVRTLAGGALIVGAALVATRRAAR